MKKQLFVALTLAGTFCSTAFPQTQQLTNAASSKYSRYKQIDFNWSYTPNLPACSSSTTACLVGFTLKDTTSGSTIATPSALGPTTLSYSYFPAGGVQYGVHSFLLIANGFNETGAPIVSAGAKVTVTVAIPSLNAPTKLVEALQ
jgi:hypothetical protein